MNLTIAEMAMKLQTTPKAILNRLYRKGIKPIGYDNGQTNSGLVYKQGLYPRETLELIK